MTADARADGHEPERGPAPEPEDSRLGQYRLVQRLGEGGMGVVHLAIDRHGRAHALKLLRRHVADDPDARARLRREVDTLSRIRSPHVAPVVDADVDGDVPYLVTRYVDGPSLDERVGSRGPLSPGELHHVAAGLADALDAIHSAGVVHRDVKPGNVLLVDGEDPVLIDFGIAHLVDDVRLTSVGLVMGTPGYLAPEVVSGEDVTPATDWWGWAATTAFAASGTPPFGGGGMNAVLARVAAGEPDLVAVDPRIEPLLYAALSPYPDERPHQGEVVRALESYAHGAPATESIQVRRSRSRTEALEASRTAMLPAVVPPASAPPAPPRRADPPPPTARPVDTTPPWALPPGRERRPDPRALPARPRADARRDGEDVPSLSVDPRIGRPTRTGTLLAMLALLAGVAAAAPLVAVLVLLVWMVLARTSDRSVTSLVMRRHERGARGSDMALAVASSPWHLLVGLVGTVLTLVLPLLVGACAMFAAALVLGALTQQEVRADAVVPLLTGAVFTALTAWWGPGGASLRRGSRSLVRGVTGQPRVRQVVVVALLLAAVVLVVTTLGSGGPSWWPRTSAPGWVETVVPLL
ncbi:serine/threonine-protein kinase [Phycicoccus flavus]|uniref:serine/threonine-protein kinase n=1 Tax=Phycicoccus flavus TaxID=2502783 RepID=UPI000FEBB4CF|nr:serine/threonine-protein kinase [Phycicoccus flavus]NHA69890.1 serine/threonine protein kinase [Phycicoccus flavus]